MVNLDKIQSFIIILIGDRPSRAFRDMAALKNKIKPQGNRAARVQAGYNHFILLGGEIIINNN